MRFFFSGELDAEIADQYRVIRQEVEAALNDGLGDQDYGGVLNEIGIIPMILGPRFSEGRKERRLVKRDEKTADYRLFIDYKKWTAGSHSDRKRLLLENVLACVEDIDRKLKGGFNGKRLSQDILRLFPEVGLDR